MTKSLPEDHVAVFGNTLLELLLEVAAAVLILAELRDLANKVLQTCTREPVDCTKLVSTTPVTARETR